MRAQHAEGNRTKSTFFFSRRGRRTLRQAQLKDCPATLADLLNGYNGDQYILLRDQMIIVKPVRGAE